MITRELYTTGRVESFMPKVYAWMFTGLLTTATVAYFLFSHITLLAMIFSFKYAMIVLFIAQISLIIYLEAGARTMSFAKAAALFLLYTVLMGVSFAPLFIVYEIESMVQVFMITAGMFGIMALYGYFTKTDLTRWGNMLLMGLLGLIMAYVVNRFVASSRFDWYLSLFGVVLFTVLTAYDVQKIKQIGENISYTDAWQEDIDTLSNKLALLGAITLYLDFVNLFLKVLRLTGKKNK
jgi:FtsH-binding integral membrane protein